MVELSSCIRRGGGGRRTEEGGSNSGQRPISTDRRVAFADKGENGAADQLRKEKGEKRGDSVGVCVSHCH